MFVKNKLVYISIERLIVKTAILKTFLKLRKENLERNAYT